MLAILLMLLVVAGALAGVVVAWPGAGGITLFVITALGTLGLFSPFFQQHRLEALFLFKGACLGLVAGGWGLGIMWGLQSLEGPDAALVVSMIIVGSVGLLALGGLEAEVRATATLGERLRSKQVRNRDAGSPSPRNADQSLHEVSRYLERLDSQVLEPERTLTQAADEDSTSRLSDTELRQVEMWGERLRNNRNEDATHLFTSTEVEEMRSLAERLGPDKGEPSA